MIVVGKVPSSHIMNQGRKCGGGGFATPELLASVLKFELKAQTAGRPKARTGDKMSDSEVPETVSDAAVDMAVDAENAVDPDLEDPAHEPDHDLSDVEEDGVLDYAEVSRLKASKRKNMSPSASQPIKKRQESHSDTEGHVIPEVRETMDEASKRRQNLEAKFERALKRPKIRRRKDEHDLTNDDDEVIQILKQQMDSAAKKDAELIENGSGIAVNKVQLLPKVRSVLSKVNLAEVILDNNLLAELRQWLEPLPDASLPSYEIQKTLFTALLKLPINTNHLRESGIGKILLFYQKSKRVEPKIKRVADKLISDWTRPIIGASDNYRDKRIHSVDFDARRLKEKESRPHRLTAEEKAKREAEKSIYEQQAARRNRAAAPAPTVTDYKFAPKSNVNRVQQSIVSAGVGSSLNRDDQFKRINQKLSKRHSSKKGGISIEGRGMGT